MPATRACLLSILCLIGTAGLETADESPVRIEPDTAVVPANHLKFYLHFPSAMERGDVFRHLRLVEIDAQGKEIAEVPDPFRDVELWDDTFTRLTLWFHPGRQKPGVNLNVEIGPILEAGDHYALEIAGAWRTEAGSPLSPLPVRHRFQAGPMDEAQPRPDAWRIDTGTSPPRIVTDDQLDPVSLRRSITIETADGTALTDVTFRIDTAAATTIRLLRATGDAWRPGHYRLVLHPRLEDFAGNSLARPFNLDLGAAPAFQERTEPVILPFEIPRP